MTAPAEPCESWPVVIRSRPAPPTGPPPPAESHIEHTPLEVTYLIDTLETLKGNVRRVLRSELSMLDDTLHALDHGKVEVVKDHLERVSDALRKLLNNVK